MHSATGAGAALLLLALAAPLPAQLPSTSGSTGSLPRVGPGGTLPYGTEMTAPSEVLGKTLSQWKQDLSSADSYVRAKAIGAVVHFGPASSEALTLLLQRCSDRDVSPRTKAVIALRLIHVTGKDKTKVVETLAQRLYTGTPYGETQAIVRYEAACGLRFYGDSARPVLAALVKGAEDPACCETRHACLQALRAAGREKKGAPDPRATNAMLRALHDSTADVRLEAILGLGSMGRPADPALLRKVIDSFHQVLHSRAPRTHLMWAHVGLLAMDDKLADSSLKAIARYLESTDMQVRAEAAHVLGAIGEQAKPYVPTLVKHLSDKEPVAISASAALSLIKDTSPRVLDALVKQLDRPEPFVVASACQAMTELGVSSPAMLKALRAAADRPKIDKDLKNVIQATIDHFSKTDKQKAATR